MILSGESFEEAIVVSGISQEYEWLTQRLGHRGKDWELVRQLLIQHEGQMFDEMVISLADGSEKSYFFRLPAGGKLPWPPIDRQRKWWQFCK